MERRNFEPAYLGTHRSGLLKEKARAARRMMESCALCPRRCGVDRSKGQSGICKTGADAVVAAFEPHFGEEAPLVGRRGSGTIFFSHCSLLCRFCQNYEISHLGEGDAVTSGQLAAMMLRLQELGCHNVNLVTPTHVAAPILEAVDLAAERGLRIPLVYNTSGYELVDTLELFDGVVDIYMPDFKFWDPAVADAACDAPDYPEATRSAIREMHRQVGDLSIDADGIARRGLLLRHLILPDNLAGTGEVMRFVAEAVSPDTYVNVMAQYRPMGRAASVPGFGRRPRRDEIEAAMAAARLAGIHRLDRRVPAFVLT